jgi:hypothetical protein
MKWFFAVFQCVSTVARISIDMPEICFIAGPEPYA